MNLIVFFTLAFAFVASVLANTEYENAVSCGRKSPATNAAISAFCNRRGPKGKLLNNIVVPSPYALAGKTGSSAGITLRASITGNCAPAQWVPITYCTSQFQSICGNSVQPYGQGMKNFGRNNCQYWILRRVF